MEFLKSRVYCIINVIMIHLLEELKFTLSAIESTKMFPYMISHSNYMMHNFDIISWLIIRFFESILILTTNFYIPWKNFIIFNKKSLNIRKCGFYYFDFEIQKKYSNCHAYLALVSCWAIWINIRKICIAQRQITTILV
jgi:hypothetical protein